MLYNLTALTVPSPHKYFLVYPLRLAHSPKLALFRQWLQDEIAAERRAVGTAGSRKALRRGAAAGPGAPIRHK